MAQGTRVRWIRAAVAGLGMVLSTGLVGCMNWDKPKETKNTTPKAGLPGTPTISPGGVGAANAKWQPGPGQYAGPGSNLQQTGGSGAANVSRTGTNNLNTTAGAGLQNAAWPPAGSPAGLSTPAVPGAGPAVQPAGGFPSGPVGAAPIQPAGGAVAGYGPTSPPPIDLSSVPLPPPAPGGNEFAGAGTLPPVPGPISPPLVPPGAPVSPSKGF